MRKAKLISIALALLVLSISIVFAQDKPALPMEVTDFQVSLVDTTKWQSMNGNMGIGMGSAQVQSGDSKQLLFTLKCKNSSAKVTATLYWEARFTDRKDQLVLKQFKTKKKIKSGKDEVIEEPLTFDLKQLPDTVKVGYRIVKIEYSDNSLWENSDKPDSDSAYIYRLYRLQ